MPGPLSGPRSSEVRPPAHRRIVSITEDLIGSRALVTTTAPHGLSQDDVVVISGSSVAGYNGQQTIFDDPIPTETTFVCAFTLYTVDATGGSWSHA